MNDIKTIVAMLFLARDAAHTLHLGTKSFAAHVALGELYTSLVEFVDGFTEMYQGQYGIIDMQGAVVHPFESHDAVAFINAFCEWAKNTKQAFNPEDSHILSEWDVLLASAYKTKYKLENLA